MGWGEGGGRRGCGGGGELGGGEGGGTDWGFGAERLRVRVLLGTVTFGLNFFFFIDFSV